MRRTYERGIKARLSFSGGPHAPVNMAESMEERKKTRRKWHVCCAVLRYISYAKFSQILEVLQDFDRLWIQKQSNYRHSPYYPPCLQERVARQRS